MPTNCRALQEPSEKLRSGDIYQVAEVVRNLSIRDKDKGLSAGEKRMLSRARQILVSELTFALGSTRRPRRSASTRRCPEPSGPRMAIVVAAARVAGSAVASSSSPWRAPGRLVVVRAARTVATAWCWCAGRRRRRRPARSRCRRRHRLRGHRGGDRRSDRADSVRAGLAVVPPMPPWWSCTTPPAPWPDPTCSRPWWTPSGRGTWRVPSRGERRRHVEAGAGRPGRGHGGPGRSGGDPDPAGLRRRRAAAAHGGGRRRHRRRRAGSKWPAEPADRPVTAHLKLTRPRTWPWPRHLLAGADVKRGAWNLRVGQGIDVHSLQSTTLRRSDRHGARRRV